MVDRNDKVSEPEERALSDSTQIKTCVDCGTSKTPLWRGGPAGPKSLCNACGIRSRKKRRALLGLNKEEKKTKKSTGISSSSFSSYSNNCNSTNITNDDNNSTHSGNNSGGGSGDNSSGSSSKSGDFSLKKRLLSFGRDFALQRPRSSTNQRRKLGEVEQAAFLLMALSCGSVNA